MKKRRSTQTTSLYPIRWTLLILCLTLAWGHGSAPAARAASVDISCGPDRVSELIAAIHSANGSGQAETLHLAAGCIYTLTAVDNDTDGPNGLPSVTGEIVVYGNGATIERAEDGPDLRIFHIAPGGRLTLHDVTLRSGSIWNAPGGAIYNARSGTVRLHDCMVRDNYASDGGGIYNDGGLGAEPDGTLELVRSTVHDNLSWMHGGGIYNNSGVVTLTESTLSDNLASYSRYAYGNGGAVFNGPLGSSDGLVRITGCALVENGARLGGGISNRAGGVVEVTNSTISDNGAEDSGGVYNAGGSTIEIVNSTISYNTAIGYVGFPGRGPGIWNIGGTVELANVIVAWNKSWTSNEYILLNCAGDLTSLGHNLDNDGSCGLSAAGDISNTDPLIGLLQDNLGPTRTRALLPGSPAIDAGDGAACPETDQRGAPRPWDGDGDGDAACDIGAFEFQESALLPRPGRLAGGPAYQALHAHGSYAYGLVYSGGWLEVVDVSDPLHPLVVRVLDLPFGDGHDLWYGEWGTGRYVFTGHRGGGLAMVDVSDPLSPTLVSTAGTTYHHKGLQSVGRYLYYSEHSPGQPGGIRVYDLSSSALVETGSQLRDEPCQIDGNELVARSDGSVVYQYDDRKGVWDDEICGGPNEKVLVYDTGDKARPAVAHAFEPPVLRDRADFADMVLSPDDRYLYLALGSNGLLVYDVGSALAPTWIGTLDDLPAYEIALDAKAGVLYASGAPADENVRAIDVSDPAHPRIVQVMPGLPARDLWFEGGRLYATTARERLVILAQTPRVYLPVVFRP
jgi:hypothetical protein